MAKGTPGFFDVDERLAALSAKGDDLERVKALDDELCRKLGDDGLRKAAYRGWRPNRPESPKENDTP